VQGTAPKQPSKEGMASKASEGSAEASVAKEGNGTTNNAHSDHQPDKEEASASSQGTNGPKGDRSPVEEDKGQEEEASACSQERNGQKRDRSPVNEDKGQEEEASACSQDRNGQKHDHPPVKELSSHELAFGAPSLGGATTRNILGAVTAGVIGAFLNSFHGKLLCKKAHTEVRHIAIKFQDKFRTGSALDPVDFATTDGLRMPADEYALSCEGILNCIQEGLLEASAFDPAADLNLDAVKDVMRTLAVLKAEIECNKDSYRSDYDTFQRMLLLVPELEALIDELGLIYFPPFPPFPDPNLGYELSNAPAFANLQGTNLGAARAQNAAAVQQTLQQTLDEREAAIRRLKAWYRAGMQRKSGDLSPKARDELNAYFDSQEFDDKIIDLYEQEEAASRLKAQLDRIDAEMALEFPELKKPKTTNPLPSAPPPPAPSTPGTPPAHSSTASAITVPAIQTPEAASGGVRHDLTPERDIRDAASKVAMVDFQKRGNKISEEEGEGLPAYGNLQQPMIAEQHEHRFDKPLDPMSPRRPVALTQSAADAFTHTVLLVVVTLFDLTKSYSRGILRGQDAKGKDWALFTLFATLPSNETAKIMYWGDMAAEAMSAVGRSINVYTAADCTRMVYIFKRSAESVGNTFDFAGPSTYQGGWLPTIVKSHC